MPVIPLDYEAFKANVLPKGLLIQYVQYWDRYDLYAFDGNLEFQTTVHRVDVQGVDNANEALRLAEFESTYKTDGKTPAERRDAENTLIVVEQPRGGASINYYSPNLCDPTTWYVNTTFVQNYELTDTNDPTPLVKFQTSGDEHVNWIDLLHGRLFQEDAVLAADTSLAPVIETSTDDFANTTIIPQVAWGSTPQDASECEIDFVAGTVTFGAALPASTKVRATFHKAPDTFIWTLAPNPGKRLKLSYAEVQFTDDVVMMSSIVYQTYAYNPAGPPTPKIPVTAPPIKYKTWQDLMWEATGPFPTMSAVGGTSVKNGGRGIGSALHVIPFTYQAFRDVRASLGVELQVTLDSPGPYQGEFASCTFYCLEEPEA